MACEGLPASPAGADLPVVTRGPHPRSPQRSEAVRPPRITPTFTGPGNVDLLNYEIVQEKAATLSRIGKRLQGALDALAAYDAAHRDAGDGDERRRDELVSAAGEALWYYVIQREVCGLRDTEGVMRHLGVPREVRLRMGYVPRPKQG